MGFLLILLCALTLMMGWGRVMTTSILQEESSETTVLIDKDKMVTAELNQKGIHPGNSNG